MNRPNIGDVVITLNKRWETVENMGDWTIVASPEDPLHRVWIDKDCLYKSKDVWQVSRKFEASSEVGYVEEDL